MAGILHSQKIVIWQSSWKHQLAYRYETSPENLTYGMEICDQQGYWNQSRSSGVARILTLGPTVQDRVYSVIFRDWESNSSEGMMYSPHAFSWQVEATGDTEFLVYDADDAPHTTVRPPSEYFASILDLMRYLNEGKRIRVRQRAFEDSSRIAYTTLFGVEFIGHRWVRPIRVQNPTGVFSVSEGCLPVRTFSNEPVQQSPESALTGETSVQYVYPAGANILPQATIK